MEKQVTKSTRRLVAVRLPLAIIARLQHATNRERNIYAPTITSIIERGVQLALDELEGKH